MMGLKELYKIEWFYSVFTTNIPVFQHSIIPCGRHHLDVSKRLLNSINFRIANTLKQQQIIGG